jgi:hypothetical protein
MKEKISTSFAPVESVGVVPPAHLTEAGQVTARDPLPSCVKIMVHEQQVPDVEILEKVNVVVATFSVAVITFPDSISTD